MSLKPLVRGTLRCALLRRLRFVGSVIIVAAVASLLEAGELAADDPTGLAGVQGRKPVRSLLEMRRENVVIQKWDLSCGAATLATLLAYQHNDPVPEKQIALAMMRNTSAERVKSRLGFSLLDLKRYAEARGYEATGYAKLTIEDVVGFAPAIVPVDFNGYSHFVVFRGKRGDRVLLADPAYGNRSMRLEVFLEGWKGRLGFVVRRRDGSASAGQLAANPDDFVRPAATVLNAVVN